MSKSKTRSKPQSKPESKGKTESKPEGKGKGAKPETPTLTGANRDPRVLAPLRPGEWGKLIGDPGNAAAGRDAFGSAPDSETGKIHAFIVSQYPTPVTLSEIAKHTDRNCGNHVAGLVRRGFFVRAGRAGPVTLSELGRDVCVAHGMLTLKSKPKPKGKK